MAPSISALAGETRGQDCSVSSPKYQALEIDLSEVTPVELLHESDDSRVFRGRWQEKDCCHYTKRYEPDLLKEYEIDPFLCESRAYCRLKARGLCEKGHIPDFYGLIHNIELKTDGWESHLQPFSGEPELPNAVVIEFIPNLRPFELSTYSPERADQLKATLIEMHELGVLHGDLERRNVKVQEERNRALWIDFDRAVIFPLDSRTEREEQNMRKWVAEEQALLSQTLVELAEDHKRGKIWWSWYWHYGWFEPSGWTEEDTVAKNAALDAAKQGTLAAEHAWFKPPDNWPETTSKGTS
ncbi:uncharacterized protein N7458_007869 [Penicillium daleae]|uniref:Protein kinase domain-containing protein n=1 Tax=Penicillium daleae TaxID=63821 RepID=A0AAD6G0C4_9EURO|nr:uncharacterized protein N7458_007869 [Penicillium daleae]KAJ5443997.1 hypothetical protein N7458_007869 [Penicillium daleae]